MCSLSEPHRKLLASKGLVKPQPTDEELVAFFDEAEKHGNIKLSIDIISGLPYFDKKDAKISEEKFKYIKANYRCFSELAWGRLHAQPGAPAINDAAKYNMKSYAVKFDDFLKYSEENINKDIYPDLSTCSYPYIYFKESHLNSMVTQHYINITSLHDRKECFLDTNMSL